jgi:hypothetical protein
MTAKTPAQRQAKRRARLRLQGLEEVRGIFATAEQSARIKEYALKIKSKGIKK